MFPVLRGFEILQIKKALLFQCLKLRMRPALCVHILAAGCTDSSTCAPGVYMLSNILLPLYKEEHMDKLLGEQFWLPMYMAGAQCKTLILNTDICTHRSRQKICIHAPYMWC